MKNLKKLKKTRIYSSPDKPRLIIFRSLLNIHAQLIDDSKSVTLASSNSLKTKSKNKVDQSKKVAKLFSDILKEKKIKTIKFDRGRYVYKGRIKVFVDELRNNGIEV